MPCRTLFDLERIEFEINPMNSSSPMYVHRF